MQIIENKKFPYERDLYNSTDLKLINCRFEGIEDGESALKECNNIELIDCFMDLRYPLWHDTKLSLNNVTMTDKCRAALWYSSNIQIRNSNLLGIKALRECNNIEITDTTINSQEFGWRSKQITGQRVNITGEYAFFECENIKFDEMTFTGKYSFQYVKNLEINNSTLKTKDAFWHAENVTVKNATIIGEYLAWYSKNLTLINCKIIGTQPFCYCENLKLINCEMENTDLAFEYSDVEATINSSILSVKNPKSGFIEANKIEQLIITTDSKYPNNCIIKTKELEY